MSEENVTTKIGIDISELKKNITEANRRIRSLNAEFKSATAGMDSWSDSTDGLAEKVKQMTGIVEQEKIKLSALEEQYKQIAETQGKDSKAAEELYIKMKNQEAAVGRASASLKKYTDKLNETIKQEEKGRGAFAELQKEIAEQEKELDRLKDGYKDAVIEFGDTSKEAKELGKQIDALSGELSKNRKLMSDAKKGADNLEWSLKDTGDAARDMEKGFSTMKVAIGILIADGLKALAKSAVETMRTIVVETEKAYGSFQAQTGASTKEMNKFKKEIDELYKNNYGDSIQDVADAMAEVKQQTKETDPSKLKELTENALALRDTFDMDVKESMRAVNMLMEQFGVSGGEAYNLIVQGAQDGLDKNGDLLDTINEYGVHYRQLGYDADEFFNSLSNGTKAGTFSVDKLGDAMKEFGIRTKDTATTSQEGFELLGYGASVSAEEVGKTKDQIAKLEQNLKYAKMEQKEFNSKTSELTKMKNADKIKEYSKQLEEAKGKLKGMSGETKNSSGSVKELQKRFAAGGEIAKKATKEVLEKLMNMDDKVKQNQAGVDLFGTMWEDLGIEGVKALMKTNGTLDMTKKSMEEMKKVKYDNVASQFETIGRTLQMDLFVPLAEKALPCVKDFAEYTTTHLEEVVTGIKLVGGAIATVFVVNKVATFTQSIMTMAGVFTKLKAATEGATIAQTALNFAQKMSPAGLVVTGITALIGGAILLANNLPKVTSKWGELTEEERKNKKAVDESATSYRDMKKATDESVKGVQSQFGYYDELKKELDQIVDKNGKVKKGQEDRANFIVNTLNKALGTEIKLTNGVVQNYKKEKKVIDELIVSKQAEAILNANESDYNTAIEEKKKAFDELSKAQTDYRNTTNELSKAQEEYNKLNNTSIDDYVQAGGTVETYRQELFKAAEKVESLRDKQYDQMKTMNKAEDTWVGYNSTIKNYEGLSSAIISGDTKKINSALSNMTNNFITAEQGNKRILEKQVKTMKKNYSDLQKAVKNGTPGVTQQMVDSAKKMVDKSEKELDKLTPKAKKSGQKTTQEYREGLELGKNKAGKTAEELSKMVEKKMKKVKSKEAGENFVKGLKDGMEKGKQSSGLIAKVGKLADDMLSQLKKKLDIHSPSKKTEEIGKYFTLGTAKGIEKAYDDVGKAVTALAKKSLSQLKKANKTGKYEDVGSKVSEAYVNGITKQEKKSEKAVQKLINRAVKKAQKETKNKKSKESFKKLGENLAESFSTAFSKAAEKATEKVQKKIESMTSSVQEKYDAIKDLQDDLQSRLSGGDLFTKDDDGKIMLADFKSDTAKIIQYGKNMEALKKTLSSELMTEIAALDTSDGLDLTTKLLSLSKQELEAYNKAYTEKINASKKVASTYYSEQVKQIKDNYTKQVKTVMAGLEKQLENIGENAMKGFVRGFNSKNAELNKSAKQLKKTLVNSIKKELGIHSPSKVMDREAGVFIIPGLTQGIERKLPALQQAMKRVRENVVNPMKNAAMTANLDMSEKGARNIERTAAAQTNTYNFYQTNNSPKALSRWDIYRQSRNLLGGVSNV